MTEKFCPLDQAIVLRPLALLYEDLGDLVEFDQNCLSANPNYAIEKKGHDEEPRENEKKNTNEFSQKIIKPGDRFGQKGVESAILHVAGDEQGGCHDANNESEELHCADKWSLEDAELFTANATQALRARIVGELEYVQAEPDEDKDKQEVENLHAYQMREGVSGNNPYPAERNQGGG